MILVRGTGVVDGEEHSCLYGLDGEVECFVDKPDEREWLVVLFTFLFLNGRFCEAGMYS